MNCLTDECLQAIFDRLELAKIKPKLDEKAQWLQYAIEAYIKYCKE